MCRKFIWPTKHPSISYALFYKPIVDGGTGLKNLRAWNKALIVKSLWKIYKGDESLWIKWISQEHRQFVNIWYWNSRKEDSPLVKQLLSIKDEIADKRGSVSAAEECMETWFGTVNGLRKAYHFFVDSIGRWSWKPIIWKSCILPKYRFSMWLFAHKIFFTRDRQPYIPGKQYVLCDVDVGESFDHLFFGCGMAITVWLHIREWLSMRKIMGSNPAVLRAFRCVYRGNSELARLRVMALAATIYHIWNTRNRAIFENEKPDVDAIVRKIKIVVLRCAPRAEFLEFAGLLLFWFEFNMNCINGVRMLFMLSLDQVDRI